MRPVTTAQAGVQVDWTVTSRPFVVMFVSHGRTVTGEAGGTTAGGSGWVFSPGAFGGVMVKLSSASGRYTGRCDLSVTFMLSSRDVCQNPRRIRQSVVLVLLVAVVVLDQAAKWWAWRHVSSTRINSGGDVLVGQTIGTWYAGPVSGALLDLLDVALLSTAVSILARCRATAAVRVSGVLMTGGWGSNLSDRLGMHYWTAPGSVRGVVDFIHIGEHYYNAADFFIVGCTPLFLLAAGYQGVRALRKPVAAGSIPSPARSRLRARVRIPALAGAVLILVVALGAANYGGVNVAPRTPPRKTTDMHLGSRPHAASHAIRTFLTRTPQLRTARCRPCEPDHGSPAAASFCSE